MSTALSTALIVSGGVLIAAGVAMMLAEAWRVR